MIQPTHQYKPQRMASTRSLPVSRWQGCKLRKWDSTRPMLRSPARTNRLTKSQIILTTHEITYIMVITCRSWMLILLLSFSICLKSVSQTTQSFSIDLMALQYILRQPISIIAYTSNTIESISHSGFLHTKKSNQAFSKSE